MRVSMFKHVYLQNRYCVTWWSYPHSHSTPPRAFPDTSYTPYSTSSSHRTAGTDTTPAPQQQQQQQHTVKHTQQQPWSMRRDSEPADAHENYKVHLKTWSYLIHWLLKPSNTIINVRLLPEWDTCWRHWHTELYYRPKREKNLTEEEETLRKMMKMKAASRPEPNPPDLNERRNETLRQTQ